MMRILLVTAVEQEADVIQRDNGVHVVASGVARTNAAAATTEAILQHGPFDAVLSVGLGGALPESELNIGDTLIASSSVYFEEGMISPSGFTDMEGLGYSLGDFSGNVVPVDQSLLETLSECFPIGPIATVATCSGTNEAAAEVVRRTGALVEAMEGAAVVHAARRFGVSAIELRAVSNTTGDRSSQQWDLQRGLKSLGESVARAVALLQG